MTGSEITILTTNESITLTETTPVQTISSDENFIYFIIKINDELLQAKTLKSNIYKKDYTNYIIVFVLICVAFILSSVIMVILKKSKKK